MRQPKRSESFQVNSTVIVYSKLSRNLTSEKYYQEREGYEAAEKLQILFSQLYVILYSKSYRRLTFEKYYQEREDYEAAEELTGTKQNQKSAPYLSVQ